MGSDIFDRAMMIRGLVIGVVIAGVWIVWTHPTVIGPKENLEQVASPSTVISATSTDAE